MAPNIPIIIGIGDIKNRSTAVADAKEPAALMLEAVQAAINDASSSSSVDLQAAIDSIDVVRTWTWPYHDLPGLLAEKLGVQNNLKWKRYSDHGGDKPGKLFDEAAKRIAKGECNVAVITGGEALASHIGAIHKIGAPIHVYPLYENAFRAYRGQTPQENHEESAKLYAEFAKIAEKNERAWSHGSSKSEEEIKTVGKKNRMICYPYPLLMNAFNTVNLASAILLTTPQTATSLSIPPQNGFTPSAVPAPRTPTNSGSVQTTTLHPVYRVPSTPASPSQVPLSPNSTS
ncbi:hypothetical protein CFE70_001026 [Pyrenophora teres f. teres 0-1]